MSDWKERAHWISLEEDWQQWKARAEDAEAALAEREDELRMLYADFNDCNAERARWQERAEAAEAALASQQKDEEQ